MAETYCLAGEEETCEAAHKMRDELRLQLDASWRRKGMLLRIAREDDPCADSRREERQTKLPRRLG